MDEVFKKNLEATEAEGKRLHGESWDVYMAALHRATAQQGGISEGEMRSLLKTGNAANLLAASGRHQLMDEASAGDKQAEMTYSKIRNAERDAYRKMRGR
jgi:hypothetical protein